MPFILFTLYFNSQNPAVTINKSPKNFEMKSHITCFSLLKFTKNKRIALKSQLLLLPTLNLNLHRAISHPIFPYYRFLT